MSTRISIYSLEYRNTRRRRNFLITSSTSRINVWEAFICTQIKTPYRHSVFPNEWSDHYLKLNLQLNVQSNCSDHANTPLPKTLTFFGDVPIYIDVSVIGVVLEKCGILDLLPGAYM